MSNDAKFSLTHLIICEGKKDKAFFNNFIKNRGLPRFHVRDTSTQDDRRGGITKFEGALRAIKLNRSFNNLDHIILVADNDESPEENFITVMTQAASAGFSVPERELERSSDRPSVAIMMLPLNKIEGNLEHAMLAAARKADRTISGYVDQFTALVGADGWSNSRRGKAWLRSILAVRCIRDPFISLRSVFDDDRDNLIPLSDSSLDPIAEFLRSYGSP